MDTAISGLGTILGVWAHPDDESFMVGGILNMAAANGQQVICVTATKGEQGIQDVSKWPAATLGEIREQELKESLEILGVQHHHQFDYGDSKCADVDETEAVSRIVELIEQYKPDTIITFPPDGLTGHPDHQAVSRWARQAAQQSDSKPQVYFAVQTQEAYDSFLRVMDEQFNVYFATDNPIFVPESECDILVKLQPEVAEKKATALKVQESQFTKVFESLGFKGVEFALGVEGLVKVEHSARWDRS
jgi:LmbE family N-acetylglucosaminyl deacetylase